MPCTGLFFSSSLEKKVIELCYPQTIVVCSFSAGDFLLLTYCLSVSPVECDPERDGSLGKECLSVSSSIDEKAYEQMNNFFVNFFLGLGKIFAKPYAVLSRKLGM